MPKKITINKPSLCPHSAYGGCYHENRPERYGAGFDCNNPSTEEFPKDCPLEEDSDGI